MQSTLPWDTVLDCGLQDLALVGHQFMWSRGRGTLEFVEERLDRGMGSQTWVNLFSDA